MKLTRRSALALLAAGPALRAEPISSSVLVGLERLVEARRTAGRVPGLSVAVGLDGKVYWERGFGSADLEHAVPTRPDTRYRTASIAKPMTAVAALKLVEDGKLDLDVPIQRYAPTFPEKRWALTARHLLGHLGGVRHYEGEEFASTRRYDDLESALDIFRDDPLLFEPGSRFSYTTYGFNLLGRAVEGASGRRFMDYLEEVILHPAGMWSTRTDEQRAIIPHRSRGYVIDDAGVLRNCDLADTSSKIPGGGLLSTAGDLVRFALAVQHGRLLAPATVDRMFTPQKTLDGATSQVGLGWFIAEQDDAKRVYHSGGQQGTTTRLVLSPDRNVVLAVMANLERWAELPALCDAALDLLLRHHS